jgi:hypothetical protein
VSHFLDLEASVANSDEDEDEMEDDDFDFIDDDVEKLSLPPRLLSPSSPHAEIESVSFRTIV